jgi:hypothetical protein
MNQPMPGPSVFCHPNTDLRPTVIYQLEPKLSWSEKTQGLEDQGKTGSCAVCTRQGRSIPQIPGCWAIFQRMTFIAITALPLPPPCTRCPILFLHSLLCKWLMVLHQPPLWVHFYQSYKAPLTPGHVFTGCVEVRSTSTRSNLSSLFLFILQC